MGLRLLIKGSPNELIQGLLMAELIREIILARSRFRLTRIL